MKYTRISIFLLLALGSASAVPSGKNSFNGSIPITKGVATFEVQLSGNSSSLVSLSVMGPKVVSVTAKAIKVVPAKERKTVRPWTFPLVELSEHRTKTEARGCLPAAIELPEEDTLPTFEELGLSPDLYQRLLLLLLQVKAELALYPDVPMTERCSVVSLETKALIESTLSEAIATAGIPNATWTPEDTCLLLNTRALEDAYRYFAITPDMTLPVVKSARSNFPGASRLQLSEFKAVMRKDSCDTARRKLRYKLLITIRFDRLTTDGQARISFTEQNYSGYQGASIKPESEGKFAPQPILLMSPLTSCFQELSFVSWRKGRPTVAPLRLEDTISYRGNSYNRLPIGGILGGGRGVFDLENGQNSYGVCFSLSATRQGVNGYPIPMGD